MFFLKNCLEELPKEFIEYFQKEPLEKLLKEFLEEFPKRSLNFQMNPRKIFSERKPWRKKIRKKFCKTS